MSKILDVLTGTVSTDLNAEDIAKKAAKSRADKARREAKKVEKVEAEKVEAEKVEAEKVEKSAAYEKARLYQETVLTPELESLAQLDHTAAVTVGESESLEWAAFKAFMLQGNTEGIFEDRKTLSVVQGRLKWLFNETGASFRNTMLSNTMRVGYGDTVGRKSDDTQHFVSGTGWQSVLDVIEKATSIRAYHKLIREAKPEGFKATPKTESEIRLAAEKKEKKEKENIEKELNKGVSLTHDQAFLTLLQTLQACEPFILPGTNSKELLALHTLSAFLKGELKAA